MLTGLYILISVTPSELKCSTEWIVELKPPLLIIIFLKEELYYVIVFIIVCDRLNSIMISEVGRNVSNIPAISQIQKDCRKGDFDVLKNFEQILYVCDVKRKKHNSYVAVLPYNGYSKCLKYIGEHHLSVPNDERMVINHYLKVLSEEIAQRQEEYDEHYFKV